MKWIKIPRPQVTKEMIKTAKGSKLAAEVLASRGVFELSNVRAFLDPAYYHPSPPEELPGMQKAVNIIIEAIQKKQTFGVWGDFDVDGQTATTVLVSALKMLGVEVVYHIPVRARESHGVNISNLAKMIDEGVQVVLTCDTGISAHNASLYAMEQGVKYIITDHHDLPAELPLADAIINSKLLPRDHPLSTLPGVGVVYKLVEALFNHQGFTHKLDQFLDLVALGIVADVAHLYADARYLLQRGLGVLRETDRLGLQILLENAEFSSPHLTEEDISYGIAPRLNSLGRLDDANVIVDFLTSQDESSVRVLANRLDGLNAQRKLLSSQVFQAALYQLEQNPSLAKSSALVLASENWPAGVVGIVANRLSERFKKPTVLLVIGEDRIARGSARSVPGCDITNALAGCSDILEGYGGHPMAAGMSLPASKINYFRSKLSEQIDHQLGIEGFEPEITYLHTVQFEDINFDLLSQVEVLAPFGPGNQPLVFVSEKLKLKKSSFLGRSEEHLKLLVEDESGTQQEVIWWQGAGWDLPNGIFDLAFSIRKNSFQGKDRLQLELVDFKIVEAEPSKELLDQIKVVDFRHQSDPKQLLEVIKKDHTNIHLWVEGPDRQTLGNQYVLEMLPKDILVIWHAPHQVSAIRLMMQSVEPTTVYFFGIDSHLDTLNSFIKRLAGLCKYVINHKEGRINLNELASAMAHSIEITRLGLAWLESSGKLSITEDHQGAIRIGQKKITSYTQTSLEMFSEHLAALLRETKSFRKYLAECTKTQLESLIRTK